MVANIVDPLAQEVQAVMEGLLATGDLTQLREAWKRYNLRAKDTTLTPEERGLAALRRDGIASAVAKYQKGQQEQRAAKRITKDGMYRNPETGEFFKVQIAVHGSGHLYAKKLVVDTEPEHNEDGTIAKAAKIHFEIARGMVFKLRPEWRLTLEQAQEFGALYGSCIRCGRTLTLEESIARKMGSWCFGKEFGE